MKSYEAFAALYAQTPLGMQARDWLDRHRRMVAWNKAVLINTAAGYRAFLAKFPDSDLTATARKLEERLRNRPDFAAGRCRHGAVPQNVALRPVPATRRRAAAAEEGRRADQAGRSRSAEARRSQAAEAGAPCPTMMSWWFAVRRRARSMSRARTVDRHRHRHRYRWWRRLPWRRQLRRRSDMAGPGWILRQ